MYLLFVVQFDDFPGDLTDIYLPKQQHCCRSTRARRRRPARADPGSGSIQPGGVCVIRGSTSAGGSIPFPR